MQLSVIFLTINGGRSLHRLLNVSVMNLLEGCFPFKFINSFLHFYFIQDQTVSIGLKYELEVGINKISQFFLFKYLLTILL